MAFRAKPAIRDVMASVQVSRMMDICLLSSKPVFSIKVITYRNGSSTKDARILVDRLLCYIIEYIRLFNMLCNN